MADRRRGESGQKTEADTKDRMKTEVTGSLRSHLTLLETKTGLHATTTGKASCILRARLMCKEEGKQFVRDTSHRLRKIPSPIEERNKLVARSFDCGLRLTKLHAT